MNTDLELKLEAQRKLITELQAENKRLDENLTALNLEKIRLEYKLSASRVALECCVYAIKHPESNQQFAIDAAYASLGSHHGDEADIAGR